MLLLDIEEWDGCRREKSKCYRIQEGLRLSYIWVLAQRLIAVLVRLSATFNKNDPKSETQALPKWQKLHLNWWQTILKMPFFILIFLLSSLFYSSSSSFLLFSLFSLFKTKSHFAQSFIDLLFQGFSDGSLGAQKLIDLCVCVHNKVFGSSKKRKH